MFIVNTNDFTSVNNKITINILSYVWFWYVNRYTYIFDNVTYFTIILYIIGNITIQGTKLGNLTTTVSNFTYFHFM